MKLNTKIVFIGIAGLAIASGVGLYLQKRRKKIKLVPQYWLQRLRAAFQEDKKVPFDELIYYFTKAYNEQLDKQVSQYLLKTADNIEIKNRHCKKPLQNSVYYECLDCSAFSNFNPNQDRQKDDLFPLNVICEDCFDQEIHRGHKYKIKQNYDGSCDCGNSYQIKESSFCCSHKGFSDLKKNFDISFPNDTKIKVISCFKELFFMLFDCQCDMVYSKTKLKKKPNEDNFEKYNNLLTLIIDQILEIVNTNNEFIYVFTQLFQEGFDKPIVIDLQNSQLTQILNTKKYYKNNILEFLFILHSSLNEKSKGKLNVLLQVLSSADGTFLEFLNITFMKYVSYGISVASTRNNYGRKVNQIFITSLKETCKLGIRNPSFLKRACLQNEEYVLTIIRKLNSEFTKSELLFSSDLYTLITLFEYIYQLLKSPDIIENFKRFEEVLEEFLDFQEEAFKKVQILDQKVLDLSQYTGQFSTILESLKYQICIMNELCELALKIQKGQLNNKKEQILKILCQKYMKQVLNYTKKNEEQLQNKKQEITYIGLSIASQIINITIISEGPDLSPQSVMNAIKKNFNFKSQIDIYLFIKKISNLLENNIVTNCFNEKTIYLENILQFIKEDTKQTTIQNLFTICSIIPFSQYLVYDFNTLTQQLISPLLKYSDKLTYKMISEYKNKNIQEFPNLKEAYLKKPTQILFTTIFDQTPLININNQFKKIISKGREDIERSIQFATKQVINNILRWVKLNKPSYNEFYFNCEQYLQDVSQINSTLKEFGDFNKELDTLHVSPKKDLEEVSFNVGRLFNYLEEIIAQNPMKMLVYSDDVFEKLYPFQKELIIKSFFDVEILKTFIKVVKENVNSQPQMNTFVDSFYFYPAYWAQFIKLQKKSPQLFNREQTILIKEFAQNLLTKNNYEILKPLFSLPQENEFKDFKKLEQIFSDLNISNISS